VTDALVSLQSLCCGCAGSSWLVIADTINKLGEGTIKSILQDHSTGNLPSSRTSIANAHEGTSTNAHDDDARESERSDDDATIGTGQGQIKLCRLVIQMKPSDSSKLGANLAALPDRIRTVLKRERISYGRTALCLSGGAMLQSRTKSLNRSAAISFG
jgi:hypothetical protein